MGPCLFFCCSDGRRGGVLRPTLGGIEGSLVRVWSTGIIIMVAMAALCGKRIRYTRLLIHDDLTGGVEEGGDSSGRRFHRVVDFAQSTYFTSLVLEASDRFKGSKATISALGCWSLGTHARRLPYCQQ
jgi:hypothetical protein